MKRWKRLFFYLLLNVLVSTITVLGVLFIWENTHLKDALTISKETTTQPNSDKANQVAKEGDSVIKIVEVMGVENLPTEHIRIKHLGENPDNTISLLHWCLRDESGQSLDISDHSGLQSLELHSNGAIDIYTKPGPSTPIELYLGLEESIWSHGETVTLVDAEGNVQDTFIVP